MENVFAALGALAEPVAGVLGGIGVAEAPAQFIAGAVVICVIALAAAGVWALGALGVRKAIGKA